MLRPVAAPATSGAYTWLVEREEQEYADWRGRGWPGRYPRQQVLDRLRAGQPVAVTVGELPERLRPTGCVLPPRTHAEEYQRRASEIVTIHADDRVTLGAEGEAADALWAEAREL
ncbi:hypothetical protein [Mycobacterium bourgelatii]|nr:hypothetical protein [Mycobacterium bourgelatii]MCV6975326.1 hypothetical protein [Mycobacterium bourgelatii]